MKFGIKKLYINGELREAQSGTVKDIVCPGNLSVIASLSWAQKVDTLDALMSAEEGFRIWSNMPLQDRLEWINKLRTGIINNEQLLRESVMYEMGKTWESTSGDFTSLTDSLKYYSQEIRRREDIPIEDLDGTHEHKIVQQPLGVVVAFLAYNFPLLNLGFKLGPALAAGCSIILKPSDFSPLSAYIIGEICHDINFPPGVINIICGEVVDVGIPLCESKVPRLITMIGSTETAQKLIQQSSKTSIKRYSMECGGNAPFIVFDDADINLSVEHGADLKLGNTGQICVAPNRFFIHESIIDSFINELAAKFSQVNIGFGKEEAPDMGPLANKQSLSKLESIVGEALDQGGQIILGGKPINRSGYFFEPTIIKMNDKNAPVLQREIFGPIAVIVPFSNKEEVLHLSNNTDVGLASYVYSRNKDTLQYFIDYLEFGEVHLNGFKYDIYLPHGGVKNSGIGVDCSTYALDDYLVRKRVTLAIN